MRSTAVASTSRILSNAGCVPVALTVPRVSLNRQQKRRYADSPTIAGGKLAQIIRDSIKVGLHSSMRVVKLTIKATGPIPISRYMQFCLSHPTFGYYSKGDVFGRQGDFITSPEISQIFGELVGIYFLTRYMANGKNGPVRLVELGPGRGTLMDDVLRVSPTREEVTDA